MSGSRELRIDVACNDPNNGLFAGRVEYVQVTGRDWDMSLYLSRSAYWRFTDDAARLRFRIGRQWFPYKRAKEWYGNWCWNAYWMKRPAAIRLLHLLRDSDKWACEEGPSRLFQWFNRRLA